MLFSVYNNLPGIMSPKITVKVTYMARLIALYKKTCKLLRNTWKTNYIDYIKRRITG